MLTGGFSCKRKKKEEKKDVSSVFWNQSLAAQQVRPANFQTRLTLKAAMQLLWHGMDFLSISSIWQFNKGKGEHVSHTCFAACVVASSSFFFLLLKHLAENDLLFHKVPTLPFSHKDSLQTPPLRLPAAAANACVIINMCKSLSGWKTLQRQNMEIYFVLFCAILRS